MITDTRDIQAVDIIDANGGNESYTIRCILESFGLQTRTHYIGNVKHLISILKNNNYLHEIIIICSHGSQDGILIPELSPELEINMPFHKKLTFEDLDAILNFNKQLVINTGCCLGKEIFANVFINKGAKAYIGATEYIEGNAIVPFLTMFFYFYICKKTPLYEAFKKAQNIDSQTNTLKLFLKR